MGVPELSRELLNATDMVLFKIDQVGEVLQKLHEAGVEIMLSNVSETGFNFGFIHPDGSLKWTTQIKSSSISNTINQLAFEVVIAFPKSPFTRWYKDLLYA